MNCCATGKGGGTISINMPAVLTGAVTTCSENMEKVFHQLYRELYSKLVRQAAFVLGDPVAAEDVAQEAFVRLHRTGLSQVDNPAGWLSKVTNNLCFDFLRSEGSRRRREEKYAQPAELTSSSIISSTENVVIDKEEIRLVQKALGKLQPRDRMVLVMKFSGYSYDEIAATVELNKSSVGTILARARERFKREYEGLA